MAALDEPEAARPAGDLGDLPGVEIAPLLAVELLRLGEEQRLAREIDAVPEHVRRAADVGLPVHEALDLEPTRRQRHRAVEHGDLPRLPAVQLAGEREHGTPAEGDDDGPGRRLWNETAPVQSSGALRSKKRTSACGNAFWTSGSASTAPSRRMCRYSPASSSRVQAEPRSVSSAHWTSSSTSTSPESGAISAVQQMIGASLVDPLLAGDEADVLGAELRAQAAVRLLGEHPQRRREDAAPRLGKELECGVSLARVGRPDVRDDGLRLGAPEREDDLRLGNADVRGAPLTALPAARPLLAAAVLPAR